MTQMSLGLDMPSNDELAQRAKLTSLPDGEEALIAEARKLLLAYHKAALAADRERMLAINELIETLAEKLNEGTRFGIATDQGAYDTLREVLAATDGQEPMWGQPGRFIVTACGCRCLVVTKGLFGFGGFDARAIDFGRPFISKTGYRSFTSGWNVVNLGKGETVARCTIRAIETTMSRENNGKSNAPKLVKIECFSWMGGTKITRPVGPDLDDPAWQPGGWLHEAAKNPPPLALES